MVSVVISSLAWSKLLSILFVFLKKQLYFTRLCIFTIFIFAASYYLLSSLNFVFPCIYSFWDAVLNCLFEVSLHFIHTVIFIFYLHLKWIFRTILCHIKTEQKDKNPPHPILSHLVACCVNSISYTGATMSLWVCMHHSRQTHNLL